MPRESSNLKVGDKAPSFRLLEAWSERAIALEEVLQRGPAIIEFLRGTW